MNPENIMHKKIFLKSSQIVIVSQKGTKDTETIVNKTQVDPRTNLASK